MKTDQDSNRTPPSDENAKDEGGLPQWQAPTLLRRRRTPSGGVFTQDADMVGITTYKTGS